MPWKTESVMDQRVEFVIRAQRDEESIAGKLVVTFRHLTVREIDLRTGKSTAVLLPVRTSNKRDGKQANV